MHKNTVFTERYKEFTLKTADLSQLDLHDMFDLFGFIHVLVDDCTKIRIMTIEVIREFTEDGCVYLELRTTPKISKYVSSIREYVSAVLSGIAESAVLFPGITVKLILSIDRKHTLDHALRIVELCNMSSIIVGVDFCGNPTLTTFSYILPAFIQARKQGLKITLHLGEVKNVDISSELEYIDERIDSESAEMIKFHPERLGHCTFLSENVKAALYSSEIPIEICMTSNVACKSVLTYQLHHFKTFKLAGHPCVICTDDLGIFGNLLSDEYAIAAKAFGFTRSDLYNLSYGAIDYIFGTYEDKLCLIDLYTKYKDTTSL